MVDGAVVGRRGRDRLAHRSAGRRDRAHDGAQLGRRRCRLERNASSAAATPARARSAASAASSHRRPRRRLRPVRARRGGGSAGRSIARVAGRVVERAAQVADELGGGRVPGARDPSRARVRRSRRARAAARGFASEDDGHRRADVRERLGRRRRRGSNGRRPGEELPRDDREARSGRSPASPAGPAPAPARGSPPCRGSSRSA